MARRRRRSAPRPARRKSSGARRKRMYTVTCASCGAQMQVPVQPPEGVELTCVECLQADQEEVSTATS